MRVKVKKGDCQSIVPGLILILFFGGVSSYIFWDFIKIMNGNFSFDSFMNVFADKGFEMLFGIVFVVFDIYFIYTLLKAPKRYRAYLISKKNDIYRGQDIVNMSFKVKNSGDNNIQNVYNCYTTCDNSFQVGCEYIIKIREFNWEIRAVEEMINCFRKSDKVIDRIPNISMSPVFLAIGFIFGGGFIFSVVWMIYNSSMGNDGIIRGLLSLVICLFTCVLVYFTYRRYNIDNSNEINVDDTNKVYNRLENTNILNASNKILSNLIIKQLIMRLVYSLLIWYSIWFVFIGVISNGGVNQFVNSIIGPLSIPVTFIIIIYLLMMIPYIGYDDKLLKKYGINCLEENDIRKVRNFRIFRPTKNMNFEKYFIVDDRNNLLYKVQRYVGMKHKYVIVDKNDKLVGEIVDKVISLSEEYLVRLVDKKPFLVRRKLQMQFNYEIFGIDYEVLDTGNDIAIRNKNGDLIAVMEAMNKNNDWVELGDTYVSLENAFVNNDDIIFISLCVTIGNFHGIKDSLN